MSVKSSSISPLTDSEIRIKYPKVSETEHVRLKDMWGGSHSLTEDKEFLLDMTNLSKNEIALERKIIKYPDSLYKCFDEALVNTIDHFIKQARGLMSVTYIKIIFDKTDGSFFFENDGAGIECLKHPDMDCYIPQMIFGKLMTGSNINKDSDSPTGGTNGVGIKIANALSKQFDLHVEWLNSQTNNIVIYDQTWNTLEKCTNPKIITKKNTSKNFRGKVSIKFWPDYTNLYKINFKEIYEDLNKLFQYRCQLAADYLHFCSNIACKNINYNKALDGLKTIKNKIICPIIIYNDIEFSSESLLLPLSSYVDCLSENQNVFECSAINDIIGPNTKKHPLWDIEIGVITYRGSSEIVEETSSKKGNSSKKIPTLKGPICISNINGVVVKVGKHFDFIIKQIVDAVAAKTTTILQSNDIVFKKSMVTESLILRINAIIPSVGWKGQRKDEATVTAANLQHYKISQQKLEVIVELFHTALINNLKNTMSVMKNINSNGNSIIRIEKYDKARFAGHPSKKHLCGLFLPEGDSARAFVRLGIPSNKDLSFDFFGILTLRGVIINVRKESNIIDEETHLFDFTTKLQNNKFFNAFKSVTGLDIKYKYDPKSPNYKTEMSKLKYGFIVGCVDQDHAGVGFIFSLIINMFLRFWPNLIQQGYVRRFITPVRRAIPKNKNSSLTIKEFYSDFEYNNWVKAAGADAIKKYEIHYYKGLAGTKKVDVKHMFNKFNENIMKYVMTVDSGRIYEEYFGANADLRKEILKVPYESAGEEILTEQRSKKVIVVDDHARFEAKAHKLTNIIQKLPSCIDGMNESGRKILFGAIKILGKCNKEVKVAQVGAKICSITDYLYGEQCLIDSIPAKAAYYVGGRQLPPLVAVSDAGMGSRDLGGGDAGQSRYLKVKLNTRLVNLIYPPEDNDLLEYMISDGLKVEPRFYVPTIPMAILESMEIPADGWKIAVWARDAINVIEEVKRQIINYNPLLSEREINHLPPDTNGWTGEIRYTPTGVYTCGQYIYDKSEGVIKITELPLRVWTSIYKDNLEKKAEKIKNKYGAKTQQPIGEIINKSPDNKVDIEVYVSPALIEELSDAGNQYFDGIEEFFGLKKKMNSNLNMVAEDGKVIEFKEYEEVFSYWFDFRREIYKLRVNRQIILLKIQIIFLKNKLRYIEMTSGQTPTIKMRGLTEDEAVKILEKNMFQKINRARYNDYSNIKTEDLIPVILEGKKVIIAAITESDELSPINDEEVNISSTGDDDSLLSNGEYDSNWNYKYLLSTTDMNRLKKSVLMLENKLKESEEQLKNIEAKAKIGKFIGAQIWLDELNELEKVIKFGRETNWFYEDFGKEKYD
jgi:DNA topoisomerase-2